MVLPFTHEIVVTFVTTFEVTGAGAVAGAVAEVVTGVVTGAGAEAVAGTAGSAFTTGVDCVSFTFKVGEEKEKP